MTEEEAKKKWCPYARSQTEDRENAPAVNRTLQGQIDIGCHCIASACMAWRHFPPEEWGVTEPPYHPSNVGIQPTDGFCGLAGKP